MMETVLCEVILLLFHKHPGQLGTLGCTELSRRVPATTNTDWLCTVTRGQHCISGHWSCSCTTCCRAGTASQKQPSCLHPCEQPALSLYVLFRWHKPQLVLSAWSVHEISHGKHFTQCSVIRIIFPQMLQHLPVL